MGPGTGLGLGYLTKPKDCRHYEVHASEGGHSDFSVVNQEDWDLHQFTLNYIKNSNLLKGKSFLYSGDMLGTTDEEIEKLIKCAFKYTQEKLRDWFEEYLKN